MIIHFDEALREFKSSIWATSALINASISKLSPPRLVIHYGRNIPAKKLPSAQQYSDRLSAHDPDHSIPFLKAIKHKHCSQG